ncbi:MAG: carboxypeptidase-like regulatory domain-containing protein [Prolixibacteraceae bacterium]
MGFARINIFCLFLMLPFISSGQSGNNTLNRAINFETESITKADFLDSLSKLYHIHFSYNPELLDAQKKIAIHSNQQPLFSVLKEMINTEELNFKALNNQVIFFPIKPEESAELIVPFKLIKGVVLDERKEHPLPYCNIGVLGKAVGTMTNLDGRFAIKIPEKYWKDTLSFSCIGYESHYLTINDSINDQHNIVLRRKNYQLKPIDIIKYDPEYVLSMVDQHISDNYDREYTLLTTFYREMIQENNEYTDISEAVLQVMKAPYTIVATNDHVKFMKGRKGAVSKPFNDIRFRLKGGPYYITKLDLVKNNESFINPEFRHLYSYEFDKKVLIDDRESAVINFAPIFNLRDILYEGKIYVDIETWAIASVDFRYTKQGLKEARHTLIQKEPKHCKAIPTELTYSVQYKYIDKKWHLLSARSSLKIKINNKDQKERTNFKSVAEMLTTNIEKGDFEHFTKQEIFRSNEIFTDKIVSYDPLFWQNYNVIPPEQQLIEALKHFENQNLVITNF